MSDVNIIIKGLALCRPTAPSGHFPEGELQVLFLHPTNHELKLKLRTKDSSGTVEEDIPIALTDNIMAIRSVNNTSSSTPPSPNRNLINIINLHNQYAGTGSVIEMATRSSTRMSMSYLSISTTNFFTQSETSRLHEIWVYKYREDDTYPTQPIPEFPEKIRTPIPRAKLRNDVSITFNIPDALSELDLEITNPSIPIRKLLHKPNTTYEIIFDNNCHGDSCANDFGYYYEVLNAFDPRGYKVEMEESPIREKITFSSDPATVEAACNPVQGDFSCDFGKWLKNLGC